MPNVELQLKRDLSPFRKIAIGTWRQAVEPTVYGTLEIVMDRAMDYVAEYRRETGRRLTVTHLLARAAAEALRRQPDANAVLRFNKIYLRKRISIFMQVAMTDQGDGKVDLSGVTVHDAADKSLAEMIDEVEAKVAAVRQRKDPALEKSRGMFRFVPHLLLNRFLGLLEFLTVALNLDLRWMGVPNDPFGSLMITNIGSLGLDMGYAPLVPFSGVPILLATGLVKEQPVVEDGKVVVRKVMKVNATIDHRFIDGVHAAGMSKTLREWLENPYEHFGAIARELPVDSADAARVSQDG